jgi:hypothetical protein
MLSYMKEVDQAAASGTRTTATTLRKLITSFVARAGPDGAAQLLNRLAGQLEQDSYLTGISERK